MTQNSRLWDGHTTGDAIDSPYSDLDWAETEVWKFTRNEGDQGVIYGVLNNLEVWMKFGGTDLYMKTGAALVNGRLYYCDAQITLGASPFGVSRWWVVGLFSDESAHTIRTFSRGNYATEAAAIASISQTPGGDWELLLATFVTNAAQIITAIYDYRMWAIRAQCNDFIPSVGGRNVTDGTDISRNIYGVPLPDSHISSAFGHYRVPHRYYTNIVITPMFIAPNFAGDAYLKTDIYHEQIGEAVYNTHTATTGYVAEAIGLFEIFDATAPTITDVEEGGGDFICVSTTRDSTNLLDTVSDNIFICGWHVVYDALF
jgi:hypothetical protein